MSDKEFISDHSPDQSVEETQANLIAATRERQKETDVRCMACGKIARWPISFHWSAYKGWKVESLTQLPQGWLVLEERVDVTANEYGAHNDVLTKLLCSECRSERGL